MSWGPEPATQNLGAGFGERTEHQVTSTHFDPATEEPLCVAVIYYDDLAGLRARGLKISDEQKTIGRLPNPFPKSDGCEPPAGWEKTCEPQRISCVGTMATPTTQARIFSNDFLPDPTVPVANL